MIKYIYKNGNGKVSSGSGFLKPTSGFAWIHITDPSSKEIRQLVSGFKLDEKIFEKYFTEKKSRRYTFKPLSFVLVDYYIKNYKIDIEYVLYIVDKHYIISVSKKTLDHYENAFKYVREKMKPIKNVGRLLYEILDFDLEETYGVLRETEKRAVVLEDHIAKGKDIEKAIGDVVELKRELLIMWRRFWSSAKIIFSIKKELTPIEVDEELIRLLDDIHDSYIHQMDMSSTQREILTDALTIYQAILSNRLAKISNKINVSIKKLTWVMFVLTGVATVLTFPNTVATIFGIPHLPLSATDFNLIMGSIVVSLIIGAIYFYYYWNKLKKDDE